MGEMVTISKQKLEELQRKANIDEELLISLVRGLEDIRQGRIKKWHISKD
jgi:hypothetical protein